VNLEQLSHEELNQVKRRLGRYRVNVMLKSLVFDPKHLRIELYRVIFLPSHYDEFETVTPCKSSRLMVGAGVDGTKAN